MLNKKKIKNADTSPLVSSYSGTIGSIVFQKNGYIRVIKCVKSKFKKDEKNS
jgi:hypothetical protein